MLPANNQSSTILVYQALNQPEKVTNQTARPDLVYSQLTTIDLLLRQVKKEGIGIIFSSSDSAAKTVKKILSNNEVQIIEEWNFESVQQFSGKKGILIVSLKPGTTIRVSDLEHVARTSGGNLKWISILQQHFSTQLFKWELKYNCN